MSLPPDPLRTSDGWLQALDALVFPSECLICEADSESGPLCPPCRGEVLEAARTPACPRCAMPLAAYEYTSRKEGCHSCHGRALGFDSAVALGPYDGPIRHLVLGLKKRSGTWLARWLSDLLMEARGDDLRNLRAELAVPVPLHWRRRLSRGHNQAEVLAERLARELHLECRNPLRRVRHTEKLAGKTPSERAALLRGAFSLRKPDLRFEGGILLVDDILTTGATCGSAARVLRKAGARPVVAVVIARASGRP